MRVGVVYSPIYLRHDTGKHVERADRLNAILWLLKESGVWEKLVLISPRPATREEIGLAHAPEHIALVEAKARAGGGWLDPDTVICPDSFEVALYAAGGAIKAVEAVISGEVEAAFALIRPPGHHATFWKSMGFCIFNNIALAAKYAQKNLHINRILIIDFDVHHGNGTQDIFYFDPTVLFFSIHQSPLYPGTGSLSERGGGKGEGFNINIPLPPHCGDGEYIKVFEEILVPVSERFLPEIILVSAGYDGHFLDPLSQMNLTSFGFFKLTEIIKGLASKYCPGKLIFVLEGGYHLEGIAYSVLSTFLSLLDEEYLPDPLGKPQIKPPPIDEIVSLVKKQLGL